jgi:hypothetical protein
MTPSPNKLYLRLFASQELPQPDESTLLLAEVVATPLTLDDWLAYSAGNGLPVNIRGRLAEGSNLGADARSALGETITAQLTITPALTNESICLVQGGWAPLLYSLTNANILTDRNIVSQIQQRFDSGQLRDHRSEGPDFLDLLADKNCTCTLNTLPFAFEGNIQQIPDIHLVAAQFNVARTIIQQALPHMRVFPPQGHPIGGFQTLLDACHDYFMLGMAFLQQIAPTLMPPTSRKNRQAVWQRIFETARHVGLPLQHVCVVAALSAVSAAQRINPAKAIIKPKPRYGREDAYNAMSDLFLLFMLHRFQDEHPEQPTVLLTRDKNLAMFWMGTTIQRQAGPDKTQREMFFHPALLPLEAEDILFLQQAMGPENIRTEFR